ncbi:hypothetical protein LCL95_06550 [Bacillus timonensis]|nr:hypothetical protein [Bacillus timonensis]
MNRRTSTIVVYVLMLLGVVGFLYTLIFNPSSLFIQLGITIVIVGIIYLLFRRFLKRRLGGKDYSAYARAAKQTRRRFNSAQSIKNQFSSVVGSRKANLSPKKSTNSLLHKKKKTSSSSSHLTVIEGKKGKKKNRAFF